MKCAATYRQFINSIPVHRRNAAAPAATQKMDAMHNQFHAIIRRWHDIYGFNKGQDYTTLWNRLNTKPHKRCAATGKKRWQTPAR